VSGLWMLLLIQASWIMSGTRAKVKAVEIEVGGVFPFEIAGGIAPTQVMSSDGRARCHAVFLCTTSCAGCSTFADRYAEALRSGEEPLRVAWLVPGEISKARAWAGGHGIPLSLLAVVQPKAPTHRFGRSTVGRIWFTPMRVVLNSDGVVRDIRPSNQVPNEATLRFLCDLGGSRYQKDSQPEVQEP
jgi:hypothetical protein